MKLVARIVLFLLPFAAVLGLMEHELAHVDTAVSWKRKLVDRFGDRAEVLVLGSSHSHRGIMPVALGCEAINLANSSQSLYYDAEILRLVLDRLPRLRVVIQPVSYLSLESLLGESVESWRCYSYYHAYGIRPDVPALAMDLRMVSHFATFGNELSLRLCLSSMMKPEVPAAGTEWSLDDRGWLETNTFPMDDAGGRARVEQHQQGMKPENVPRNVASLEASARLLASRGVSFVLVTLPVFSTYSSHMDPVRLERMHAAVNGLCRAYSLEYHDYLCDPRFTLRDFSDHDHLGKRGASRMSAILRDEVLRKH